MKISVFSKKKNQWEEWHYFLHFCNCLWCLGQWRQPDSHPPSGLSLLLRVALVGMHEESPASPASYRRAVAGGSSVIMAFSGGRGFFSLFLHRNTDSGGVSRGNCGIRGRRNKLVCDHNEARWSALPFEGWFCAAMHCHLEITGSPRLCKDRKSTRLNSSH